MSAPRPEDLRRRIAVDLALEVGGAAGLQRLVDELFLEERSMLGRRSRRASDDRSRRGDDRPR